MKELVKCVECGENKEREDFRTNNARENGLSRKCIDCLSVKITSYIYIIKNPAWEEYVKVGRAKNVFSRLDCYNTSSPKSLKSTNLKLKISKRLSIIGIPTAISIGFITAILLK